jgi:hypothetical protein
MIKTVSSTGTAVLFMRLRLLQKSMLVPAQSQESPPGKAGERVVLLSFS